MTSHLALVGATASGKSALALTLAERLGDVEIVSVDSMQVYRGMDIGTAKPTLDDRARVPHHLVDVADPSEEWSVVRFRDAVRQAVAGIEERGRRALLVGGTGLYWRAVVDPLEFPPEDPDIRADLQAQAREQGPRALYRRLADSDPEAAERIEPDNERRIVRALEVIRLTGRPFSSFGPGLTHYGDTVFPVVLTGIRLPSPLVRERIADRLAAMRRGGLLDEVRDLSAAPGGLSRTAREAIGYREMLEHLDGRIDLDSAFEAAERRTRRFARRQRKWFERDPRIRWIVVENPSDAEPRLLESWAACHASA